MVLNHEPGIIKNVFPLCAGGRVLLLGIGGGGDVVGTLPLYFALQRAGAVPVTGGLTWKRKPHDPKALPRRILEFENIREVNSCIGLVNPSTRLKEGVQHIEADVSRVLGGEEIVVVDISSGIDRTRECIEAYTDAEKFSSIVAVDVGGDALCTGGEETVRSPLCDQVMLGALSSMPGATLAVIGLGADGELPLEKFRKRFDELVRKGAYKGGIAVSREDVARLEEAMLVARTESSLHLVQTASRMSPERLIEIQRELNTCHPDLEQVIDEIVQVDLRDGTRTGELCSLSAFTLFFDLPVVFESTDFAGLMPGTADIFELDRILTERGIVTELTDQARLLR